LGIGGYYSLVKDGYQELVNAIIRPPRAQYEVSELGPQRFRFGGVDFVREDMQLTNVRGHTLEASLWHQMQMPAGGAPCVVYCHANASCRAEALTVLAPVLSMGASVFALDWAGCGLSTGEYISLGWHEKEDLAMALEALRGTGHVTAIALWGRSMGAASSVMHAARDASLAGLVLDSPFASLEQVALELVQVRWDRGSHSISARFS
jgi:pimeloyl-ACP methyl ester carboxylesterase